jgi:hypothetical protein
LRGPSTPADFEPRRIGGFADKAGTSILLIRPAFWSALLPRFPRCLGASVPKLFPSSANRVRGSQLRPPNRNFRVPCSRADQ